MWITLEQIANLKAIAEEGSVSAASERLGKAKSAVHYSLRKLEEQVGFEVIDTKEYRGQLTAKGSQLLSKAEPLLKAADELVGDIHRIASGAELKLRLSASALYPIKRLNKNIIQVQKQFPQTEISFNREILSGERMLRDGVVDLAIFEIFDAPVGLETKPIGKTKMSLVISKKHPFLSLPKSEQTEEALFQYPQVVQRSTLENSEQHGVYKTTKQWSVNDLEAKKQIILDGLGWGRLPEHEIAMALRQNRLEVLKMIEKPIEVDLVLARKKKADHGPVSELLWGMSWK